MTPWGLRSKIKNFLGVPQPGRKTTDPTYSVTMVLPTGKEQVVTCEERYTLVMASQSLETPIATGCPDGHCGSCAVEVLSDTGLAPPTEAEAKILKEKAQPGQRLACHARVVGNGAKVKIKAVWSMETVGGDA